MNIRRLAAYGVLTSVLFALASPAQPGRPPSAQLEAMNKLGWMQGHWSGAGWVEFVPGERHEFTSTEKVESKLGGVVLSIDGLHRATTSDGTEGRVVHSALAVVSYDEGAKRYRFQAWLADGRYTDAQASFGGSALQWGFETPRGRMRYTIRRNEKGEWFEIGEMSNDGATWRKFFEMTLRKATSDDRPGK